MKDEEHVGADILTRQAWRSRRTSRLQHAAALMAAIAREIFDESAYQRFLNRTQMQAGTESYAEFRKEQDELRARRARCC
jgi:hypothetical protein